MLLSNTMPLDAGQRIWQEHSFCMKKQMPPRTVVPILGNTTRITRLNGTSNAVTTTFAYGGIFGQLSSVTDPLSHTSSLAYDGQGNLVTATDPLNHQSTFTYNTVGQLLSMNDPCNWVVSAGIW
jgi:YD repeat-containing protein